MLWREVDELVITQPNHAWLAGQLARAWGNNQFAAPEAAEAVCLTAEQHDLGWHEWERSPTLNRQTGKPHFFRQVAVSDHIALWRRGVDMAMAFGRYPALLISLHASGLYAQFDPGHAAAEEVAGVRDFLADQESVRQRLLVRLAGDPAYRDASGPETVTRHRALIALTDRLSIAICSGVVAPTTVAAPGLPGILLSPINGDPRRVLVDPWPFRNQTVQLVGEGRALPGRYDDEATMRADLDAAANVTILTELFPAR